MDSSPTRTSSARRCSLAAICLTLSLGSWGCASLQRLIPMNGGDTSCTPGEPGCHLDASRGQDSAELEASRRVALSRRVAAGTSAGVAAALDPSRPSTAGSESGTGYASSRDAAREALASRSGKSEANHSGEDDDTSASSEARSARAPRKTRTLQRDASDREVEVAEAREKRARPEKSSRRLASKKREPKDDGAPTGAKTGVGASAREAERAVVSATVEEAAIDLSSKKGRKAFRSLARKSPPSSKSGVIAFEGTFVEDHDESVAVIQPGEQVEILVRGRSHASLPIGSLIGEEEARALGAVPARAVRLVGDGTDQLLVHHREVDEESGRVAIYATVFKVIGSGVGRIFSRQIGVRASESAEVQTLGSYEFLRGDDHRSIRWIPHDKDGEARLDEATILEWNHWEGAYSKPGPPPTAPREAPNNS